MFIKLLFCASIVLDSEVSMEREGGRGRKREREGESLFPSEALGPELKTVKQAEQ